jgi:response regulator of citrate/malate metabolism
MNAYLPNENDNRNPSEAQTTASWQSAAKQALPLAGVSALIADRNAGASKHLKDELVSLGAQQVETVTDAEALIKHGDKPFHLIFIDSGLGEIKPLSCVLEQLTNKGLHWKAILFVISSERNIAALKSVLEYGVEEYLIKPFSTEEFSKRVIKAYSKRKVFTEPLKAYGNRQFFESSVACDELVAQIPAYKKEILRLKVRALMTEEHSHSAAEGLLREVMSKDKLGGFTHPWMEASLAEILLNRGLKINDSLCLEEAEIWAKKAQLSEFEFLAATNTMMKVLVATDQFEALMTNFESVGALVYNNVERLRMAAYACRKLSDIPREKTILQRLFERSNHTNLFDTFDMYCLIRLLLEEGRDEEARGILMQSKNELDATDLDLAEVCIQCLVELKKNQRIKAREMLYSQQRKMESAAFKPDPASLWIMGMITAMIGKLGKAKELLAKAKEHSSNIILSREIDDLIVRIETDPAFVEEQEAEAAADAATSVKAAPLMMPSGGRTKSGLADRLK